VDTLPGPEEVAVDTFVGPEMVDLEHMDMVALVEMEDMVVLVETEDMVEKVVEDMVYTEEVVD